MKALKFLSIGFLWVCFLIVIGLGFTIETSQDWNHQWQSAGEFANSLLALFEFSDHWNCIAITFLGSASVVVLCLNDIIIMRVLSRVIVPDHLSFWGGGFLWLTKSAANAGFFFVELVCLCYLVSSTYSSPLIVEPSEIRKGKYTVLLLGTSKYLNGTKRVNRYYSERLRACYQLYKNGVIAELIISGDRASKKYDETADMNTDLQKLGVKGIVVKLDPKGYRTFDSIRRMKSRKAGSRFDDVLIISQYFHLQRALYLAKAENINAKGVRAEGSLTFKMFERELFSKTRVLLDIYIFNSQTKGVYTRPRRLVDPTNYTDLCLLIFVLSSVAIAGRMMRVLLDY